MNERPDLIELTVDWDEVLAKVEKRLGFFGIHTSCPQCLSTNVQIIASNIQQWKCKHCKNEFETNYNLQDSP